MSHIQDLGASTHVFEWDHAKERSNRRKHGISFGMARGVFRDPNALMLHERVDFRGEDRWRTIGRAASQPVLLVAYVLRREHPSEVIRIVSARRASRCEVSHPGTTSFAVSAWSGSCR
jgi:uncharacterized DUF497 family protein